MPLGRAARIREDPVPAGRPFQGAPVGPTSGNPDWDSRRLVRVAVRTRRPRISVSRISPSSSLRARLVWVDDLSELFQLVVVAAKTDSQDKTSVAETVEGCRLTGHLMHPAPRQRGHQGAQPDAARPPSDRGSAPPTRQRRRGRAAATGCGPTGTHRPNPAPQRVSPARTSRAGSASSSNGARYRPRLARRSGGGTMSEIRRRSPRRRK